MNYEWEQFFKILEKIQSHAETPSVTLLSQNHATPFQVLVSTIISLRTKDKVTLDSSKKLFKTAPGPEEILKLEVKEIENLIYPAGFYRRKSLQIQEICSILVKEYKGKVPSDRKLLEALPGVGPKTAALVLTEGFKIPAICVDIHVHRIFNRMGYIVTRKPEETEQKLMQIIPESYWLRTNTLLVTFGQNICRPRSPFCSNCPFQMTCLAIAVTKKR